MEREKDGAVTREQVLGELAKIAFCEPDAKLSERMKALEMLGKPLGLWKEAPGPEDGVRGELTKLSELLEQRRQRRSGT